MPYIILLLLKIEISKQLVDLFTLLLYYYIAYYIINDLNEAIKFFNAHHFDDDTNLLSMSNSIVVNADLTHLVNWLNAKKI